MVDFDTIVLGVGGMGSSALFHLAARGQRVLGIEQYGIAHDRGSSHGQTRIIRKAYFEHPDYVPLLHRAYALWDDLQRRSGRDLFLRTGLLLGGPADGPIVAGVRRAALEHRLDIESLTAREVGDRYPGLRLLAGEVGLFERDAGILRVEACVQAYVDAAMAAGATVLANTPVLSWSNQGDACVVHTHGNAYTARSLVICAGSWAGRLLADLSLPLEVRRKVLLWYRPADATYDLGAGCPVYGFETASGFLYGFPAIDADGVKVANHTGGHVVSDPAAVDRSLYVEDIATADAFVRTYLPRVAPNDRRLPPPHRHAVCLYTMTPDEHFIIDRHPLHPNVAIAAGFSGHGFKFASVVGSILADLATTGETAEPIEFLRLGRPALRRRTQGLG